MKPESLNVKLDSENVKLEQNYVSFWQINLLIYLRFLISFFIMMKLIVMNNLKPYSDTMWNQIWKFLKKFVFLVYK